MQYILESNKFTAITETEGTIVNISNVPAEISLSGEFGTGIVLFPRQHLPFAKTVYAARAPGFYGRAIVAAIGTGGLQSESFTDADIDAVFDEDGATSPVDEHFDSTDLDAVFVNDDVDLSGFSQADIDAVFEEDGFSDDDIHSIFDDDFSETFTDDDIQAVFDGDFSGEDISDVLPADADLLAILKAVLAFYEQNHSNDNFTQDDIDSIFAA